MDNPYSSPMAPPTQMLPAARKTPTPGSLIFVFVVLIIFGAFNLLFQPCALGVGYLGLSMLESAAELEGANADPEVQQALQAMEQLKSMLWLVVILVVIGLIFGVLQLVVAIGGFKRSSLAQSLLPIVCVVGIIPVIANRGLEIMTATTVEAPAGAEPAAPAQMMTGLNIVMNVVGGLVLVAFYVSAMLISMGEKAKQFFAGR